MRNFIRWVLNKPPVSSDPAILREWEELELRKKESHDILKRANRLVRAEEHRSPGHLYRGIIDTRRDAHRA